MAFRAQAVEAILSRLDHLVRTNQMRIKEIRGSTPVAETILIELAGELDKDRVDAARTSE
jgi:hypothetical protein